eukprot:g3455.t1
MNVSTTTTTTATTSTVVAPSSSPGAAKMNESAGDSEQKRISVNVHRVPFGAYCCHQRCPILVALLENQYVVALFRDPTDPRYWIRIFFSDIFTIIIATVDIATETYGGQNWPYFISISAIVFIAISWVLVYRMFTTALNSKFGQFLYETLGSPKKDIESDRCRDPIAVRREIRSRAFRHMLTVHASPSGLFGAVQWNTNVGDESARVNTTADTSTTSSNRPHHGLDIAEVSGIPWERSICDHVAFAQRKERNAKGARNEDGRTVKHHPSPPTPSSTSPPSSQRVRPDEISVALPPNGDLFEGQMGWSPEKKSFMIHKLLVKKYQDAISGRLFLHLLIHFFATMLFVYANSIGIRVEHGEKKTGEDGVTELDPDSFPWYTIVSSYWSILLKTLAINSLFDKSISFSTNRHFVVLLFRAIQWVLTAFYAIVSTVAFTLVVIHQDVRAVEGYFIFQIAYSATAILVFLPIIVLARPVMRMCGVEHHTWAHKSGGMF